MAHLYARISIAAVNNGNTSIANGIPGLHECEFFDSSGTQISTSGGTASSNADVNPFVTGGGTPTSAFDGNSGTAWCVNTTVASVASPVWLQMQFAAPVDIDHFSLTFAGTIPAASPSNFSFQVSDDGAAWTTVYSYRGAMRLTGSYTNTFYTSGTVYRLSVTAVQSGSQATFSNIKFFDGSSTLITGVLGKGSASTWDGGVMSDGADPIQGYNQTCATWFTSAGTPSSGSPEWVDFQFPSGTATPASLSFQTGNHILGPANAPVVFSLQSSTDGANFTTLQTFASAAWTTTCQTQTFNIVTPARSISASPVIGVQCQTGTVTITGLNTHFVNGTTTVAISGPGATVSSVSVSSSTSLTFSLALSCTAQLGVRTITVTTSSESDTAPFVVEAGPTIASLLQGNIALAQIRLGFNGRFGTGMYFVTTDGSILPGEVPVMGGPDGQTLVGSGTATAFLGGGPIAVNGAATVQVNGAAVSFDNTVLINGA